MWKLREKILSRMQVDGRMFGLHMWSIAHIGKVLTKRFSIIHETGTSIRLYALRRSERRVLVRPAVLY